jgi:hypothetical protein
VEWDLSKVPHHHQEVLVVHANAALTPTARLRLGRMVCQEGWTIAGAAQFFRVSWPTAKRWTVRYQDRAVLGPVTAADTTDASSRPHRTPTKTPLPVVKKVVHLRWKQRLSPRAIAGKLRMPASTVHAVLTRCRVNRLSHIDIHTGGWLHTYNHHRLHSAIGSVAPITPLTNVPGQYT